MNLFCFNFFCNGLYWNYIVDFWKFYENFYFNWNDFENGILTLDF